MAVISMDGVQLEMLVASKLWGGKVESITRHHLPYSCLTQYVVKLVGVEDVAIFESSEDILNWIKVLQRMEQP